MGYSDYPLKNELMLETYWNSSIPPADALLGIRYVLDNVQPYGYEKAEVDQELPEGYELYKNESALPLAFRISDGDMSGRYHEDPFVNQNTIFSIILGEEANLYTELRANKADTEDRSIESYRIDIDQDGPLYLFVDGSRVHADLYQDNCELIVNGELLQKICRRFRINAVYAGTYQKGDTVQVDIRHSTENEAHYIYAVQLNTAEFQECIDSLRANNCVTDLKLEGATVSAVSSSPDAARILFTIPYDKGWTVKVDGKKTEYHRFANTFIMLDVEAGEHVIEMSYTVPGSIVGMVLSLLGIVGFAVSDRWRKKRKNKGI